MKNSKKKMLILAIVSVFVTCSIVAQAEDEGFVEKVASVEHHNGSVIEFYQVDSGPIFLVETGKAKSAQLLGEELDPTMMTALEIYKSICPDCEVPDALVAEHEETGLEELPVEEVIAPQTIVSKQIEDSEADSVKAVDDECPWSWFSTSIYACSNNGSYYDFQHETVAAAVGWGGAGYHGTAACSYRNECDYWVQYSATSENGPWTMLTSETLDEGDYSTHYYTWGGKWFWVLSHIDCQADSGGGHLCGFGDPY